MPINDLWQGFLEDKPESAYFSYQNQWRTPNQKRYFQSQFGNIQNQYMGQLGSLIRNNQAPTSQFTDFLNKFNWSQNFQENASPGQRGLDTSRFSPWTRWLV